MRGRPDSSWRQVLTGAMARTGPGAAAPGGQAVDVPVRRGGDGRRRRRGEQPMVPDAEFASYYGRPVIKEPVWRTPGVPGYLFLGGLAGASSVLAGRAQPSGRPRPSNG